MFHFLEAKFSDRHLTWPDLTWPIGVKRLLEEKLELWWVLLILSVWLHTCDLTWSELVQAHVWSYWARVTHTLYIPLSTWSSAEEWSTCFVGEPTIAFGCHSPEGVCVGETLNHEGRKRELCSRVSLSKHFVVARVGKEFRLNSL